MAAPVIGKVALITCAPLGPVRSHAVWLAAGLQQRADIDVGDCLK